MGHYSGGLRRVCKRGYQGAVKHLSTASLSRNGHVPQVPPVKPIELSSKRIHLSLFICSHFGSSAPVFYLHAAAMPADRKEKTKGCDVASQTLTDLVNSHIPLASCKPRELWKLDRINAAGHTSEWAVIQRNSQLISELLEVTSGRILHQLHLRTMLMSLVPFRRNSSKSFRSNISPCKFWPIRSTSPMMKAGLHVQVLEAKSLPASPFFQRQRRGS